MSEQDFHITADQTSRAAGRWLAWPLACCVALVSGAQAAAPQQKVPSKVAIDAIERLPVGKSLSPKAMIFSRETPAQDWQLVDENAAIRTNDLLLGLPGARLATTNGAVTLTFLSDLDQISPYPVIESAVVLRESHKVDLEFTLDRGRVDVINTKKQGSALVRVYVRNGVWDLTLADPGARVALETYSRWPRGVRFTKESKGSPTADLVILILKGEVGLKHAGVELPMKAPPGPSIIEWDSVTGMDECCHNLEKLPSWASSGQQDTPTAKATKERLEKFRQRVLKKPLHDVIEEMLNADNPDERRGGAYAAGAFDQLGLLGQALRESKYPDLWDNGVIALRHWIGREPGQDQILYKALIEKRNYRPVEAETVLQLLHSFSDEEVARPELYDALIAYLNHDNLGVRGLAYWHLSRLVPQGKKFNYNPMASKDDRTKAIEQWKKLIPSGQVPPKPQADAEK